METRNSAKANKFELLFSTVMNLGSVFLCDMQGAVPASDEPCAIVAENVLYKAKYWVHFLEKDVFANNSGHVFDFLSEFK